MAQFVLDAVASLSPRTRSMFGCLAINVQDKIVLILRSSAGINNVTRSRPSYGRAAIVGASFLTFAIYVKSALMSWFPLELFKFFGPVGLLRYSKIS